MEISTANNGVVLDDDAGTPVLGPDGILQYLTQTVDGIEYRKYLMRSPDIDWTKPHNILPMASMSEVIDGSAMAVGNWITKLNGVGSDCWGAPRDGLSVLFVSGGGGKLRFRISGTATQAGSMRAFIAICAMFGEAQTAHLSGSLTTQLISGASLNARLALLSYNRDWSVTRQDYAPGNVAAAATKMVVHSTTWPSDKVRHSADLSVDISYTAGLVVNSVFEVSYPQLNVGDTVFEPCYGVSARPSWNTSRNWRMGETYNERYFGVSRWCAWVPYKTKERVDKNRLLWIYNTQTPEVAALGVASINAYAAERGISESGVRLGFPLGMSAWESRQGEALIPRLVEQAKALVQLHGLSGIMMALGVPVHMCENTSLAMTLMQQCGYGALDEKCWQYVSFPDNPAYANSLTNQQIGNNGISLADVEIQAQPGRMVSRIGTSWSGHGVIPVGRIGIPNSSNAAAESIPDMVALVRNAIAVESAGAGMNKGLRSVFGFYSRWGAGNALSMGYTDHNHTVCEPYAEAQGLSNRANFVHNALTAPGLTAKQAAHTLPWSFAQIAAGTADIPYFMLMDMAIDNIVPAAPSFSPQPGAFCYNWTSFGADFGVAQLQRGASMCFGSFMEPGAGGLAKTEALMARLLDGYNGMEAAFLCGSGLQNAVCGDPLYAPFTNIGSGNPVLLEGSIQAFDEATTRYKIIPGNKAPRVDRAGRVICGGEVPVYDAEDGLVSNTEDDNVFPVLGGLTPRWFGQVISSLIVSTNANISSVPDQWGTERPTAAADVEHGLSLLFGQGDRSVHRITAIDHADYVDLAWLGWNDFSVQGPQQEWNCTIRIFRASGAVQLDFGPHYQQSMVTSDPAAYANCFSVSDGAGTMISYTKGTDPSNRSFVLVPHPNGKRWNTYADHVIVPVS